MNIIVESETARPQELREEETKRGPDLTHTSSRRGPQERFYAVVVFWLHVHAGFRVLVVEPSLTR